VIFACAVAADDSRDDPTWRKLAFRAHCRPPAFRQRPRRAHGALLRPRRGVGEQFGYLGCQGRVQVAIFFTEDDRDWDLEAAKGPGVDERVLLVQGAEPARRPAADGCEGIGVVGAAEELRNYRLY
jgi:hypothetical protein